MASNHVATASSVQRLSAAMNIDVPAAAIARPLRESIVQFTRFTAQRDDRQIVPVPVEDCHLIVLALADISPHEVCYGGRHLLRPLQKKGAFMFRDCTLEATIDMKMNFDNVHVYFPRTIFKALAAEHESFENVKINLDFIDSFDDIVVKSLGHCLLPAFERPQQTNTLFLDHIAIALLTHMAGTYGGAVAPKLVRGGLAPRQVQRAKDVLMSRLDGEIRLEELARECGLSRSHFARAFKKTTGVPPHRWLMERRLERARALLLNSKLSLAEIADASGFAEQRDFTRCFSTATGMVPSEWRRLQCD